MQSKPSTLMLALWATVTLTMPFNALADKGRSTSSAQSESRRHSESRGESHSESHSHRGSDHALNASSSTATPGAVSRTHHAEREHDDGHERGERRSEWSEARHHAHVATAGAGTRPAMTPEALALFQQARQAAYEYRVTGSAESLAALQTLRTTLEGMGFVKTPFVPATTPPASGSTPAVTNTVAAAPVGTPATSGATAN